MCHLTGIGLFPVHLSGILQFEEFDITTSANAPSSQITEKDIAWILTLIIIAGKELIKKRGGIPRSVLSTLGVTRTRDPLLRKQVL